MNILFVNHATKACGVYQIGKRIAGFLAPSTKYRFIYLEATSPQQVIEAINIHQARTILYNFYPSTLPFVNPQFTDHLRKNGIKQLAAYHDPMEQRFIQYIESLFDAWMIHDETNPVASAKKFMTCRPGPRFSPAPPPEKFSVGSHGFGISPWKAFDTIVEAVNAEFDEAVINMNIGLAAFGDEKGEAAVKWRESCEAKITKPGITLNITHDFLETEEEMVRFLQKNTVNIYFHKDPPQYAGPAGSADLAIASQRALVVNGAYMYRHVWSELGAYGATGNLKSLCHNEKEVARLYQEWSPERIRQDYEQMLDTVHGRATSTGRRMWYGQFEPPTDSLIANFFPLGYKGHCVEFGAVDGRHVSNTLHFEEAGWDCLCIEPNDYYHEALKRNRKLFLPYAVSNVDEDNVVLHRVKIGNTYDACTSLEPDQALIKQFGNQVSAQDQIMVKARTLNSCLEEVKWTKVDFVSIDTEGTELKVLQGFDLDRWKPRLLIIENNHAASSIDAYLAAKGYRKVLRHAVNDFFLRVTL
jgi:FkbM family methyltransferase